MIKRKHVNSSVPINRDFRRKSTGSTITMKKSRIVSSSAIEKIGYDTESKQLEISFNDGTAYKYFGVPEYVYHEFINASSQGRYYNESFKKEDYNFVKIR